MDARTKGLLATIASVVLCGCPGLFLCIFGALAAAGAPVTTELNGVTNVSAMPAWMSVGMLCVALILILIPVAVGFFTLRKKPEPLAIPPSMNEPMPPAS